jgi:PHD/YefM family antitoxin component YafN of YafNO toxin-antitoxin module
MPERPVTRTTQDAPRRVGRRRLKNELPEVLREVATPGGALALTNRNRVEAYLVAPEEYEELRAIRDTTPLLLAAARAGVTIPSATLDALDLQGAFDWEALNRFQASFEVRITRGEDGAPLPARVEGLSHRPIGELDEELELG